MIPLVPFTGQTQANELTRECEKNRRKESRQREERIAGKSQMERLTLSTELLLCSVLRSPAWRLAPQEDEEMCQSGTLAQQTSSTRLEAI